MKPDNIWTASWALYDAQHYGIGIGGGNIVCAIGDKADEHEREPVPGPVGPCRVHEQRDGSHASTSTATRSIAPMAPS